jgi:hypothetical protein
MKKQPSAVNRKSVDARQKKFYRCPVAPTILRNEPFGEHAEGLSRLPGRELQLDDPGQMVQLNGVKFQLIWRKSIRCCTMDSSNLLASAKRPSAAISFEQFKTSPFPVALEMVHGLERIVACAPAGVHR